MNKIIIVVIIVIVFIGGYFLLQGFGENTNVPQNSNQVSETQQSNEVQQTNANNETSVIPNEVKNEVIYTNSGYSPSEVTIKVGDAVTFKNESSSGMWTSSAMHPSHTVYSGTSLQEHCPDIANTSFDECKSAQPGESWSFRFDKKGTWPYHNHISASNFGKIIVE